MIFILLAYVFFGELSACYLDITSLSVIIPAYNEELWIERTVKCVTNSCKEAELKDFEVIVVNDTSTDATAEIAQRNGARVINAHNRNIGKNRNQGAKEAKFSSILFLDADTVVSGRDIRRSLSLLNQGISLVVPFAQFDSYLPTSTRLLYSFTNLLTSYLKWRALVGGATLFVDKKEFEKLGGFNDTLLSAEDADFIWRVKNWAFIHTDGYTSSRRYLKNSTFSGLGQQKTASVNVWYNPNYREVGILQGEIFQPISCMERLYRLVCPEVAHKSSSCQSTIKRFATNAFNQVGVNVCKIPGYLQDQIKILWPTMKFYEFDNRKFPFPCEIHWLKKQSNGHLPPNKYNVLWACSEPTSSLMSADYYALASKDFDLVITKDKNLVGKYNNVFFSPGFVSLHTLKLSDALSKEFSISFLLSLPANSYLPLSNTIYQLRKQLWALSDNITAPKKFYYGKCKQKVISMSGTRGLPDGDKKHCFNSMFHIALENTSEENYITEKIYQCFETLTVPIYIGAPNIGEYFDVRGMFLPSSVEEIVRICNSLAPETYEQMLPFVKENKRRWQEIYEKYELLNLVKRSFFDGIEKSERKQYLLSCNKEKLL